MVSDVPTHSQVLNWHMARCWAERIEGGGQDGAGRGGTVQSIVLCDTAASCTHSHRPLNLSLFLTLKQMGIHLRFFHNEH